MSKITWGKPGIFITKLGPTETHPSNSAVWTDISNSYKVKEGSTQLSTTAGDKTEAKEEGGAVIDTKHGKATYSLSFDIYHYGSTFEKPIPDNDGVILDNYAIRVVPEDSTLPGFIFENASVSSSDNFTAADGTTTTYTFDALVPTTGTMMKKFKAMGASAYSAEVAAAAGSSASSAITMSDAKGTISVVTDETDDWLDATISTNSVTPKAVASTGGNPSTSPRTGKLVLKDAWGSKVVIEVTQAGASL